MKLYKSLLSGDSAADFHSILSRHLIIIETHQLINLGNFLFNRSTRSSRFDSIMYSILQQKMKVSRVI